MSELVFPPTADELAAQARDRRAVDDYLASIGHQPWRGRERARAVDFIGLLQHDMGRAGTSSTPA